VATGNIINKNIFVYINIYILYIYNMIKYDVMKYQYIPEKSEKRIERHLVRHQQLAKASF